jgi:hypothetical protein
MVDVLPLCITVTRSSNQHANPCSVLGQEQFCGQVKRQISSMPTSRTSLERNDDEWDQQYWWWTTNRTNIGGLSCVIHNEIGSPSGQGTSLP